MDKELISTLWGLLVLALAVVPSILQVKKKRDLARRRAGKTEQKGSGQPNERQTLSEELRPLPAETEYPWNEAGDFAFPDNEQHKAPDCAPLPVGPQPTRLSDNFGPTDRTEYTTTLRHNLDSSAINERSDASPTQSGSAKPTFRNPPIQEGAPVCEEDPLADFNLRHAVIYKEILQPKFGPQSEE